MSTTRRLSGAVRTSKVNFSYPSHLQDRTIAQTACVTKSFDAIPTRKSFLPASFSLIMSGGPNYLHKYCDRQHRELGAIFRDRLAFNEMVFIADTDMIRLVVANEGPQPHHNVPEAWLLFNQIKGIERGLFFQLGEPWLKLRRAFNKVLLADPAKILRHSQKLLEINQDLIEMWTREQSNSVQFDIRNVKQALCKWSIEATGHMLFGQRMGCLGSYDTTYSNLQRAEELVRSVSNMFRHTSTFQVIPPKLAMKLRLPSWRKFETASSLMIKLASDYATEFIEKAKLDPSNDSVIRDLIDLKCLTDDEISRTMVDLIIAAADTTSNSIQWTLYALAKNPDIQSKVYQEIKESNQDKAIKFDDIMARSSYRHAVIREVLRLYPTAPFLARTLNQAISLGGYEVPAGTPIIFSLYTTSRMDKYFDDPLEFKPERWLRKKHESHPSTTKNYAYATLPFGVGSRMCIGRRMADLEMDLLIKSLVQRFKISEANPKEDVDIKLKMILEPSKPINLRLTPRPD